jgi:hypothetical protein
MHTYAQIGFQHTHRKVCIERRGELVDAVGMKKAAKGVSLAAIKFEINFLAEALSLEMLRKQ